MDNMQAALNGLITDDTVQYLGADRAIAKADVLVLMSAGHTDAHYESAFLVAWDGVQETPIIDPWRLLKASPPRHWIPRGMKA